MRMVQVLPAATVRAAGNLQHSQQPSLEAMLSAHLSEALSLAVCPPAKASPPPSQALHFLGSLPLPSSKWHKCGHRIRPCHLPHRHPSLLEHDSSGCGMW